MLQRAASKAYSWWWASHIRTKQSKWLEQNLQDMQEKVQSVLKLIEEDGDSFAKRAEMYYKKRPELINFVEESYRAYRALAERYDHISTELQNANNTIAYVFPEQVQFDMEDEEDEAMPRFSKKTPEGSKANIPKVPKIPKQLKAVFESTNKKKSESKKSTKKGSSGSNNIAVPKSGLSKAKGLQEIDRLQKQILALQTEKEFLRSSYESGLAKYWETDQQIRDIQEKICSLQDEFGAGTLIEDEEARSLMASAALKSCEQTLNQLQEKQERSAEEAAVERKRISHARERLKSLKFEFLNDDINEESLQGKDESVNALEELKSSDQEVSSSSTPAKQELELLREKIKQHFEDSAADSLSVTEMAEKIDELVNKVISLETAVSSQTALIKRLRTETDELQSQIRTLEEDKATLISSKNDLSDKLREMEEKLQGLQDLNQSIEDQNNNLQTHFTEAHCNLDHLSVKLLDVRPDEELPTTMKTEVSQGKPEESPKVQERAFKPHESLQELQKVGPEEELKVLAKSNEQSKGQEDAKKPDDGPQEKQAGEPYLELKASDSPQKGKKSPVKATEVALPTESKEQEKQNQLDAPVKAKDNKGVEERVKEHNLGTSNEELRENASPSLTRNDTDKSTKKLPEAGEKVEPVEQKVEQASRRTLNEEKFEQASPGTLNDVLTGETPDEGIEADDESNWKQLFTDGIESREKSLLKEYTTILRNYKEVKKQLAEAEKKNADSLFDVTVQLRELKGANAKKDEQIRFLRQKLSLLQAGLGEDNASDKPTVPESPMADKEVSEDFSFMVMEQATSEIEERFRTNIDQVLEENLDFWLRFSNTFQQIQKFETEVQDLQSDMTKIEEKKNRQEGSSTSKYNVKSDARALYKHLREIHTELSVWLEKSILLKDELKSRFSSLCGIQEEITAALKESAEDEDFKFTSYQAAKFQGEILNMKQENNRVADELQAGLDHATTLQLEVEKTLAKLNEEFKISGSKKGPNIQLQHSDSRSQVPLRSFIFGVKQKKQKHSIFSCVHPVLQRKYNAARLGSIL